MENTNVDAQNDVALQDADKITRFANLMIDTVSIVLITLPLNMITVWMASSENADSEYFDPGHEGGMIFFYFGIFYYLLYYTIFEFYNKGRTIGKIVTKTKAVKEDGSALTLGDAFLRTLSRFVGIEAIVYLFTKSDQTWHDKWTKTRVIKK